MLGREPYETRFQGDTEIRGFNRIEKFLRHITPQNKLYCFGEKKNLGGEVHFKCFSSNLTILGEHQARD